MNDCFEIIFYMAEQEGGVCFCFLFFDPKSYADLFNESKVVFISVCLNIDDTASTTVTPS